MTKTTTKTKTKTKTNPKTKTKTNSQHRKADSVEDLDLFTQIAPEEHNLLK